MAAICSRERNRCFDLYALNGKYMTPSFYKNVLCLQPNDCKALSVIIYTAIFMKKAVKYYNAVEMLSTLQTAYKNIFYKFVLPKDNTHGCSPEPPVVLVDATRAVLSIVTIQQTFLQEVEVTLSSCLTNESDVFVQICSCRYSCQNKNSTVHYVFLFHSSAYAFFS